MGNPDGLLQQLGHIFSRNTTVQTFCQAGQDCRGHWLVLLEPGKVLVQQGPDEPVIVQLFVHHLNDSRGRNLFGQSLLDLADERLEWNGFPLCLTQSDQEFPHGDRVELSLIPQGQDAVQGGRGNSHFLRLHNRL